MIERKGKMQHRETEREEAHADRWREMNRHTRKLVAAKLRYVPMYHSTAFQFTHALAARGRKRRTTGSAEREEGESGQE